MFYPAKGMATIAFSELLGAPVTDASGTVVGKVREAAVDRQQFPDRVWSLVVRTREGERLLETRQVQISEKRALTAASEASSWKPFQPDDTYLLLGRDLLDQQIIDVHGRKVVRVNDLELLVEAINNHTVLRLAGVDVGTRGAVRRLLKGVVPAGAVEKLVSKLPPRLIPWNFVDLIETDPARRVKLKIEHARLAELHPADIADIVEELSPAEREAVFETLDEHVAAEALEEVDPKLQVKILESLDFDRAADIVEEMDPDAAADVLADMEPARAEEVMDEMQPEEREEVAELLEFEEDTAAGRMTTDYIALTPNARVRDAIQKLREFEGGIETVNTIFLQDEEERLVGAVPLPNLLLASEDAPLTSLMMHPLVSVEAGANEKEFAELFDKYNLLTLPVVDAEGKMTGVITADDVIALLRAKL